MRKHAEGREQILCEDLSNAHIPLGMMEIWVNFGSNSIAGCLTPMASVETIPDNIILTSEVP
jgi:hypothetical protein